MRSLFAVIFLGGLVANVAAQSLSGVFRATDARMVYVEDYVWDDFLSNHWMLNHQGFRLQDLATSGEGKERRFWGIYTESTTQDTLLKVNEWAEMVLAKRDMAARGYTLTKVVAYALSETDTRYVGLWTQDANATPHKIWKLDSPTTLREKTEEMANQQYYVQQVAVLTTPNGISSFIALYHYHAQPIRNYLSLIEGPEASFHKDRLQRQRSDIGLISAHRFTDKMGTRILSLYQSGNADYQLVLDRPRADFNGIWEQMERQHLQLVDWEVR
ncbi:MAG: hypothetical protein R2795_18085 [Saprospiraceae bacterium]